MAAAMSDNCECNGSEEHDDSERRDDRKTDLVKTTLATSSDANSSEGAGDNNINSRSADDSGFLSADVTARTTTPSTSVENSPSEQQHQQREKQIAVPLVHVPIGDVSPSALNRPLSTLGDRVKSTNLGKLFSSHDHQLSGAAVSSVSSSEHDQDSKISRVEATSVTSGESKAPSDIVNSEQCVDVVVSVAQANSDKSDMILPRRNSFGATSSPAFLTDKDQPFSHEMKISSNKRESLVSSSLEDIARDQTDQQTKLSLPQGATPKIFASSSSSAASTGDISAGNPAKNTCSSVSMKRSITPQSLLWSPWVASSHLAAAPEVTSSTPSLSNISGATDSSDLRPSFGRYQLLSATPLSSSLCDRFTETPLRSGAVAAADASGFKPFQSTPFDSRMPPWLGQSSLKIFHSLESLGSLETTSSSLGSFVTGDDSHFLQPSSVDDDHHKDQGENETTSSSISSSLFNQNASENSSLPSSSSFKSPQKQQSSSSALFKSPTKTPTKKPPQQHSLSSYGIRSPSKPLRWLSSTSANNSSSSFKYWGVTFEGRDYLDFVAQLTRKRMSDAVALLFSKLSDRELVSACGVSREWREAVNNEPNAARRFNDFIAAVAEHRQLLGKENAMSLLLSASKGDDSKGWEGAHQAHDQQQQAHQENNNNNNANNNNNRSNTTPFVSRSLLGDIRNVSGASSSSSIGFSGTRSLLANRSAASNGSCTTASVSPKPYRTRHALFVEEARKLYKNEKLTPCPRCSYPARVNEGGDDANCSRDDCRLVFCSRCKLARDLHTRGPCRGATGQRTDGNNSCVGSSKSKKNLRRL